MSKELLGTFHESLQILYCLNENAISPIDHMPHSTYLCQCKCCKKHFVFIDTDFQIFPQTHIQKTSQGEKEVYGYWSKAHCDCHLLSSFQWKVVKLLKEHHVNYEVEKKFYGLTASNRRSLLAFDFAIYDQFMQLKCLIECQGEQHYRPVECLGGEKEFLKQQLYDQQKRIFVEMRGIPLLEISYQNNSLSKIEKILRENNIIAVLTNN